MIKEKKGAPGRYLEKDRSVIPCGSIKVLQQAASGISNAPSWKLEVPCWTLDIEKDKEQERSSIRHPATNIRH